MGWYFGYATRRALINELTMEIRHEAADAFGNYSFDCNSSVSLAHCYRGNIHSGVLWVVTEQRIRQHGSLLLRVSRFINCHILKCYDKDWGYKPMSEVCHPYYYSCPLGYLRMVYEGFQGVDLEWRKGVYAYHEAQAERRQQKKLNRQLSSGS